MEKSSTSLKRTKPFFIKIILSTSLKRTKPIHQKWPENNYKTHVYNSLFVAKIGGEGAVCKPNKL